MPDIGISIIPYADSVDRSRELVKVADEGGLKLVGIQDHPYQHRFLDTFALVATLLAETRRISFFTDVANLPLRPPALMAKAAASLDALSGGRFELGLGGGAFQDGIAGLGGPRRSGGETVDAVEEAIDVIRLMWSEESSVSYQGRHYQLEDARPGPLGKPAQTPPPLRCHQHEIIGRGVDKALQPRQYRRRVGSVGDGDQRAAQRLRALRLEHAAQPVELAMFEDRDPPAFERAFIYRISRRHGAGRVGAAGRAQGPLALVRLSSGLRRVVQPHVGRG